MYFRESFDCPIVPLVNILPKINGFIAKPNYLIFRPNYFIFVLSKEWSYELRNSGMLKS